MDANKAHQEMENKIQHERQMVDDNIKGFFDLKDRKNIGIENV
jgi:hypothetical protein